MSAAPSPEAKTYQASVDTFGLDDAVNASSPDPFGGVACLRVLVFSRGEGLGVPEEIQAQFNMAAVKMLGGAAREAARKNHRGRLVALSAEHSTETNDAILRIVAEGTGYGGAAGVSSALPEGKYAFVTMLDGTIRVWPTKGEDGKDTDHPALCSFSQKVLYAAELWINEHSMISQWNNKSGAFHPKSELRDQSGLPSVKFEAHVPSGG